MYCKKCGNYIANGIDKCPMCGWVVGEEIVEEEKEEESIEKKKIKLSRLIIELLSCTLSITMIVFLFIFKYFDSKGDNLEKLLFLHSGKNGSFIDTTKNVNKWFDNINLSQLEFYVKFKIACGFIFLFISALVIIFAIKHIIKLMKKEDNESYISGILSLSYGFYISSMITSISKQLIIVIAIGALVGIITIFDIVNKYNEKTINKNSLMAALCAVILGFATIIVFKLNLFTAGDLDINTNELVFITANITAQHDTTIFGVSSGFMLIFTTISLSFIPFILMNLKKESKINNLVFVNLSFVVIYIIVSLYTIIQCKKGDYEDIMISAIFIITIVLALISSICAIFAFIINRKEYNKTKVYNL